MGSPYRKIPWNFHGLSMEFTWFWQELHGKLMEFHGNPWNTLTCIHDVPWNWKEFHGESMEFHGIPWTSWRTAMVFRGSERNSMENPWDSMVMWRNASSRSVYFNVLFLSFGTCGCYRTTIVNLRMTSVMFTAWRHLNCTFVIVNSRHKVVIWVGICLTHVLRDLINVALTL